MGRPFDDLTKALAQKALTRRDSLRWIGGGFVGMILASLGFGKLLARPADNCPDHCRSLGISPGNGNAWGKCVSNCARCRDAGGTACGAESCCFDDEVCSDGTCEPSCCAGPGFNCSTVWDYNICAAGGPIGTGCYCYATADGGSACLGEDFCSNAETCSTDADCPDGKRCSDNCCGRVCLPVCDCSDGGAGKRVAPTVTGNGPTSSGRVLNLK